MSLIPWTDRNPSLFRSGLQNWIDEFFDHGTKLDVLPEPFRKGLLPPLNVAESDKELTITLELPGMDENDVEVQVLGDHLVVSGERTWKDEKKEKEFHRVESRYGSFRRVVPLPDGLLTAGDAVHARFEKGMLEIRIPKAEPKPATKVKIRAK